MNISDKLSDVLRQIQLADRSQAERPWGHLMIAIQQLAEVCEEQQRQIDALRRIQQEYASYDN